MTTPASSGASFASELVRAAGRHLRLPWLWLRRFVIPTPLERLAAAPSSNPRWLAAHEQILTGLLRMAALLSTPALLVALAITYTSNMVVSVPLYMSLFALIWTLALRRDLDYQMRAAVFLGAIYALSLAELLSFGLSEDAYGALVAFSLIAQLLFDGRTGRAALLLSVSTLVTTGWAVSTHMWVPSAVELSTNDMALTLASSLFFLAVVGSVQFGVSALFRSIEEAWKQAIQARSLLEHERDLLEQRVGERTRQLAEARDQALRAGRYKAEQNEFLSALHETTLNLLSRQERGELLQVIIERAAEFLEAPYGALMLYADQRLVAHAFTANQPFLAGDRVSRGEGLLAWQAFDTQQPAIVDDYTTLDSRRRLYDGIEVQAVVDFPILIGARCLGVLAMGRSRPGHTFTPEEIQRGMLFSQLAAVVLDNSQLHATALHEIDERRQAEQVLQHQAELLQAQNRELDAFAHTVAHDLKGPLTTLTSRSELLQLIHTELSAEELRLELSRLVQSSFKMSGIIDALLLLSRVRSNTEVSYEALPMAEIVAAASARVQDNASASQTTIALPEHWPDAIGYGPWVEEVWVNYLSNAIKYGGERAEVALGAERQADGFVRFWVQDSGPGLSEQQQAQLFLPFTRLHTASEPGHGLGLSIVQRIVTRLGGGVGVESALGQGSRFFFTLPAAAPAGADA